MPNYKERAAFLTSVISEDILEDAIQWICKNLSPDEVFTYDQLSDWAIENDFIEIE